MTTIYDVPVQTIDGQNTTLQTYKGKTLLIVNVASRCGFTPQYVALEALYQEYAARGLMVLGVPSNQFLNQEPGSNAEIKNTVKSCFRVTFPMYAKVNVFGKTRAPLYDFIAKNIEKKPWILIPWNFTKVLVDSEGRVLRRYWPMTSFKTIKKDLDKMI